MSEKKVFPWHRYVIKGEAEVNTVVPLRRLGPLYIGEIFGYGCQECGAFWKVYQKEYHNEYCSQDVLARHVHHTTA